MSGLEQLLGSDLAKSLGGLMQQFEAGTAHEVAPEDAAAHHDAVAKHMSPADYEQAAIEAASKLTPEQRQELARQLAKPAAAAGHAEKASTAEKDPSPEAIGQVLSALQGSGGIASIAGDALGNPAVRSVFVGIAGAAAKRLL